MLSKGCFFHDVRLCLLVFSDDFNFSCLPLAKRLKAFCQNCIECLSESDVNNKNYEQATKDSNCDKSRQLLDVVGNLFTFSSRNAR